MNKKRVALALAAALGINTLVVTVGSSFGGQTTIAHATQSSGRLTNENDIKILESVKVKRLETATEIDANGNVLLSLKNIADSEISDVKVVTAFEHAIFDERKAIDSQVNKANIKVVDWNVTNKGKLTISGMTQPGIYTGDIEITFKDGNKEIYRVSLRKTPSDFIQFSSEVTAGAIKIYDVKLNGTIPVETGSKLSIREKGGNLYTVDYNATNSAFIFNNNNIKFQEGQVYELVYTYGDNNVHEVVSQIMFTKQDAVVEVFASNDTANFETDLKAKVESDFFVNAADISVNSSGQVATMSNIGFTVDIAGIGSIANFNQTYKGADVGGAEITPTVDASGVLSLKLGQPTASTTGANFVPYQELGYDADAGMKGIIGDLTINVGNQEKVYFDASSKISDVKATDGIKLEVTGIQATGAVTLTTDTYTYPSSVVGSLGHGYETISVVFDSKKTNFFNQSFEYWRGKVTTSANRPTLIEQNAPSVVASVVVSKDSLEASSVQASFKRTGESTGEITLKGANKLLPTGYTGNIASLLTVSGVEVKSGVVSGDDLVFTIQSNTKLNSTITWSFAVRNTALVTNGDVRFEGTVSSYDGGIEPINFTEDVKLVNNTSLDNEFDVVAKFDTSIIPNGSVIGFENQKDLRITLTELGSGQKTINATVGAGKYQGTYAAGIWVTRPTIALTLTADNATTTSVRLNVTGKSVTTNAINEVDEVLVQYRLKGATTWTDGTKDLKLEDVRKNDGKTISVTQSGLESGKEYEFRVIYRVKDESNDNKVTEEVIATATAKTNTSSNSTITGNGSSSTTTGTSTGSTTINVTTNNSTLTGTSASVTLPTSFRYDSNKTPVAVTFKYKDKDGKVVTETKEQFSNVTAKFNGDKVEVYGLVPGKNYDEITVDYTDNNGRTRSIILRNIQTSTTVESEKYLANVYEVVFSRPADEAGYHFHLDNLKNKKVSLREFLLNMLSEKEFIEKYKSTEEKIEALYNAIVARSSDEAGKKFWVDEYKKVLAVYGSETTALKAIADRMVNENELKELADKMGVQW